MDQLLTSTCYRNLTVDTTKEEKESLNLKIKFRKKSTNEI